MYNRKVAWLESQYLFPHHFQQQERYFEALIEARCAGIAPYAWGFDALEVDYSLLASGRVALRKASGILPDGTPFDLPMSAGLPTPLAVASHAREQLVYLSLASYRPGCRYLDVDTDNTADRVARYRLALTDVFDYAGDSGKPEPVEMAMPSFRLAMEEDDLGGYTILAIARVREVTPEGGVLLDPNFIPAVLDIAAAVRLKNMLSDALGMVVQRADALAARFNQPGGNAAIADFLLLQLLNGAEPRLHHLQTLARVHPERLFNELQWLTGELATFTTDSRRSVVGAQYLHHDLHGCFHPIAERLNRALSAVLEQTAIALVVEPRQYGIFVARIVDRSLIRQARFILAARADATTGVIREQLPGMLKIGTVETIRDLVNNQLPGIVFNALPVAPREISFNTGAVYFELVGDGELWRRLRDSAGFAIHVAGELAGLEFELWAVRH